MKKRIMYSVILALAILMFLLSVSTALATWATSGWTLNKISISRISARVENYFHRGYNYPESVVIMPGDTVKNIVRVRNICSIDIVVRLSYKITWVSYDEAGDVVPDAELSSDNVLVTYNTVDWEYEPEDGYFYYKGVLAPGKLSPAVVNEIKLDESTGNEYQNRRAHIDIYMEALQAAGEAITIWGKTFEDLDIEYEEPSYPVEVSKVSFVNPSTGFRFENNDGDLFSGFKRLLPAECRTQQVEITNLYDYNTQIFLFASITEQSYLNNINYRQIKKLLREHLTLSVIADTGEVLYFGPIWADAYSTPTFIEEINKVDLGVFAPNSSKTLTVNLWVDKDVDNKYMGLFGDVAWVFQAQAADPDDIWETPTPEPTITTEPTVTAEPTSTPKVDVTPTPPDTTPPVTGDKSLFYAAIVGIILSLGLIAAVLYRMKNDSDIKANAS